MWFRRKKLLVTPMGALINLECIQYVYIDKFLPTSTQEFKVTFRFKDGSYANEIKFCSCYEEWTEYKDYYIKFFKNIERTI